MKFISFFSREKTLIFASGGLSLLLVGLAVVGAFRSYSPVPFGDMWNGYLDFFFKVSNGDISTWWSQHNEHRILLARIFFWMDLTWLGGASWFLIAFNYVLVSASVLVFWFIVNNVKATENYRSGKVVLSLFITAWLFLWMQHENLTWAFQCQFILAQLLPLCALYWLHKSMDYDNGIQNFVVACCFGLASVGTMANGVLVLPLMTFYALLTRQNLERIAVLAALTIVTIYFYYHDYRAPAHHGGTLSQAIKENPLGLLQYVLLYVGSPFYHLLGADKFAKLTAQLAGLFLIVSSVRFAGNSLHRPREMSLQWVLLFFILYIGGTALGTAGGRLFLGVNQSLSYRYTTPALMAWAALLVLYSPVVLEALKARDKRYLLSLIVLFSLMTHLQFKALQSQDELLFQRKIAALALEMQIIDQNQIKNVEPNGPPPMEIAKKASSLNLSIFGKDPIRDVRELIGSITPITTRPPCQGALDSVEFIKGEERFIRVKGWLFNPVNKSTPQSIRILNRHGQVVGYSLTGQRRLDVADVIDKKALNAGYGGYLLSDQTEIVLTLQGVSQGGPVCQMQVSIPSMGVSLSTERVSAHRIATGSANVLNGNL